MRVLLIGNYPADEQHSMLRFVDMLARGLESRGVEVERFSPPLLFGRFAATTHGPGKFLGYLDKYFVARIRLGKLIKRLPEHTIIHICDHSNAHYRAALVNRPHIITCHDLIAIRSALGVYPQHRPRWSGQLQQKLISKELGEFPAIVSVSERTQLFAKELTTGQTRHYVIPNALEPIFSDAAKNQITKSQGNEGAPYLLHVGNTAWYKNRPAVLMLFKELTHRVPRLKLKVVGPPFSDSELSGYTHLVDHIHYCESINDSALVDLYRDASLLLFPSYVEGFGWPIIEAQACGCPVFTLNREPMSALNACPQLISKLEPEDPKWTDSAATQCASIIQQSEAERQALSEALRSYVSQFELGNMVEAYRLIYEQELAKQR